MNFWDEAAGLAEAFEVVALISLLTLWKTSADHF